MYVALVGEEGEAGRVFILRYFAYFADSRYMRLLPVVMIIIIYPVEMECKVIAVKYNVLKMCGGSEGIGTHF